MRPLTECKLSEINGGVFWGSIGRWFKKFFTSSISDEYSFESGCGRGYTGTTFMVLGLTSKKE